MFIHLLRLVLLPALLLSQLAAADSVPGNLGSLTAPGTPFLDGDRLIFLGDSITQFGEGPNGYVGLVRDAFAKAGHPAVNVINAGISGNTVPDLLGRLEVDVLRKEPSVVFIYIGINDVWHYNGDLGEPKTRFEAGLRIILSKLQARGVVVVLATPTVIGEVPNGGNPLDQALDVFSDISRALAKEYGVELCDLRRAFSERLVQMNVPGASKLPLTGDGVHLSDSGNALVAAEAARSLCAALARAQPQPLIHGDNFVGTGTATIALRPSPKAAGLVVRYTTDGSVPNLTSPTYTRPITCTATTTITAQAFREVLTVGSATSIVCTKLIPQPAVQMSGTVPGLRWACYEGAFVKLPAFADLQPVASGTEPRPVLMVAGRASNYALRFTGFISVPSEGVYTFRLESDDGSSLSIGDTPLIDNDGLHSNTIVTGVIALNAGLHPFDLRFFQAGGGATLNLSWSGPGFTVQSVPAAVFSNSP